jgi:hypothetical protein
MSKLFAALFVTTVSCLMAGAASAYTKITENETVGGENISCTWSCPSAGAVGFVYLQHGYTRSKSHMDDWAGHMADGNWDTARATDKLVVLSCDHSMIDGDKTWAGKVATQFCGSAPWGLTIPATCNGGVLPGGGKIVLAGHSAGGLWAGYVGKAMHEKKCTTLKGLVLGDPADRNGPAAMTTIVTELDKEPVIPIRAAMMPSQDANNKASCLAPIQGSKQAFTGLKQLKCSNGSTSVQHFEPEGSGCTSPQAGKCGTAACWELTIPYLSQWALDLATDAKYPPAYPCGDNPSASWPDWVTDKDNGRVAGLKAEGSCGPACGNGIVEPGEACDGGGCCQNCQIVQSGQVCRAADASGCDVAELCNGSSAECADDVKKADNTSCGTGKVCKSGACVNTPTCGNGMVEAGEECDPSPQSATDCCHNTTCKFLTSDSICGGTPATCKVNAVCPGNSAACPTAPNAPNGTYCSGTAPSITVCNNGSCNKSVTKEAWNFVENNVTKCSTACASVQGSFGVPERSSKVQADINNGTGEADLYLKRNASASTSVFDCSPFLTGNTETCLLQSGAQLRLEGTWYYLIQGRTGNIQNVKLNTKFYYPASLCGNGIKDDGEACDGEPCCNATCTGPAASSVVCRAAAAGGCDAIEYCNGSALTCPADAVLAAGTTCRAADASGCDLAETCNGSSALCPQDAKKADDTVCQSTKRCTSGQCVANNTWVTTLNTKMGAMALAQQKSFSFRVPTNGTQFEGKLTSITGTGANLDLYVKYNGAVSLTSWDCRPYLSGTSTETCTKTSAAAGTHALLVNARAKATNGTLTGKYYKSGTVYPPTCGNNLVEGTEQCDGGACCNTNCTFKSSATVCRASGSECDLAESCTGSASTCPADRFQPNTVSCTNPAGGKCDGAGVCQGFSSCGGLVYDLGCWYAGAAAQSCTTVCSTHGGYSAETLRAGSGGDNTKCNAILTGLGVSGSSIGSTWPFSAAVGCMYDQNLSGRYRVPSPATTADASYNGVRRVCACQY